MARIDECFSWFMFYVVSWSPYAVAVLNGKLQVPKVVIAKRNKTFCYYNNTLTEKMDDKDSTLHLSTSNVTFHHGRVSSSSFARRRHLGLLHNELSDQTLV